MPGPVSRLPLTGLSGWYDWGGSASTASGRTQWTGSAARGRPSRSAATTRSPYRKRCENTKGKSEMCPELMALMGHAPLQRLAGCPVGAGQQENEKVKSTRHRGTQHGREEQRGQAEQRSCRWKRFINFDWKTSHKGGSGNLWLGCLKLACNNRHCFSKATNDAIMKM